MEEVRYLRLSEILTEDQIKELIRLVKEKKKIEPTSFEFTTQLRELFKKYEKELLEKGILPDYLAYAVAFLLSKFPVEARISFLKIEKERAKEKLKEVF